MSHEDVLRVLTVIRSPVQHTCFSLMYACGLRISEASLLTISSIDSRRKVLKIIGKGNRERIVPLPMPMLQCMRTLWKSHRNPKWIFPNKTGSNAINSGVLYRTFKDAARETDR